MDMVAAALELGGRITEILTLPSQEETCLPEEHRDGVTARAEQAEIESLIFAGGYPVSYDAMTNGAY
jgi:hypothetical protein